MPGRDSSAIIPVTRWPPRHVITSDCAALRKGIGPRRRRHSLRSWKGEERTPKPWRWPGSSSDGGASPSPRRAGRRRPSAKRPRRSATTSRARKRRHRPPRRPTFSPRACGSRATGRPRWKHGSASSANRRSRHDWPRCSIHSGSRRQRRGSTVRPRRPSALLPRGTPTIPWPRRWRSAGPTWRWRRVSPPPRRSWWLNWPGTRTPRADLRRSSGSALPSGGRSAIRRLARRMTCSRPGRRSLRNRIPRSSRPAPPGSRLPNQTRPASVSSRSWPRGATPPTRSRRPPGLPGSGSQRGMPMPPSTSHNARSTRQVPPARPKKATTRGRFRGCG